MPAAGSFIHTLGLSPNAPDAPEAWAYCATLKCSFSSDSAALCLLCIGISLILRLCLFLLVRQADSQKTLVALTSQRLAAANNMLHCFGLLPAESAGWIPIKHADSIQVPSYRGMSREDGVSLRSCLSLGLIVQHLSVHSAQIQQPCAFYVEAKVSS
jgi:hypothetical protein